MKVVLLTQWFDPEPTFKGLTFARELVRQGFEVEVVTGFPNYPGGKVYPGYRIRPIQCEEIDGVRITRLPLYPSHDGSVFGRVINYASFAASSLLYGLFKMKRPDVIYAYHPPLTVGMVASLLRIIRRIPVVYDIQDMWPDTLRATGMMSNEKVLAAIELLCRWVYRRVDHLVVLSSGFKRLLVERGVPEQKVEVIYNWCEENGLKAPLGICPPDFPDASRFRIVFAGNMGKAQALGAVLQAASILAVSRPDICFVFIGSGVELDSLKREVVSRTLPNVVFIPRIPMNEIGTVLSSADALLVHLKKDPLFSITIPSKTQAYLAIGRPVLMAVPGDAAALIHGAGCGVVAEAENPQSIAAAAITLAEMSADERLMMGQRSRDYYWKHLSLSVGVGHFADCFRRMAVPVSGGGLVIKRIFDATAALFALCLLSPVFLLVAWQVRRKLGSPVLFQQVRPGRYGLPFKMVKFRTMRDATDAQGNPLPDSERMTPFGSFLRSSSLDELPELWNVLKGEMSLVGPRPLLMEYLPLYTKEQARRHEVRPGVTGWAQINGRNALSWEDKFKLDVWYVDHQSFWLDLKVLLLTVKKVLVREGISGVGEVTMSKFVGSPKEVKK